MNKKTDIIQFKRDADFYLRLGDKRAEREDLASAYSAYCAALAESPGDIDARLAAAEMLYQMGCYEASNTILMIQQTMFVPVPEIFFGLACNFYGINEFEYARQSLETYLQMDPDGPYAYDAEDFLDLLDDDAALAENLGMDTFEDFDTLTCCKHAENLIKSGSPEQAVSLLKKHIEEHPKAYRAMDSLTSAYIEMDKPEDAIKLNEQVLAEYPDSLVAAYNHAVILFRCGDTEKCEQYLDELVKRSGDFPEGLISAAGLYSLLKRFDAAYAALYEALSMSPYDLRGLYLMGYVCLMLEKYREAHDYYEMLLKIDPLDMVAKSYDKRALAGRLTEADRKYMQPFILPVSEMLELVKEMHGLFTRGLDEVRREWQNGDRVLSLFRWGVTVPNETLQESIIAWLGMIGGKKAEYQLRELLLRTDLNDKLKQRVFFELKSMNAREPFYAYIGSQWVLGTINRVEVPKNIPKTYQLAIKLLQEKLPTKENTAELANTCLQLFLNYCGNRKGRFTGLTEARRRAFAAALEYEASRTGNFPCDIEEIAARYGTTPAEMEKYKGIFTNG